LTVMTYNVGGGSPGALTMIGSQTAPASRLADATAAVERRVALGQRCHLSGQ
jgi:hypothetical protein